MPERRDQSGDVRNEVRDRIRRDARRFVGLRVAAHVGRDRQKTRAGDGWKDGAPGAGAGWKPMEEHDERILWGTTKSTVETDFSNVDRAALDFQWVDHRGTFQKGRLSLMSWPESRIC